MLIVKMLASLVNPKPEYIFRPMQIYRRLVREINKHFHTFEDVALPWGLVIRVRPAEMIGSCIWRVGLYDLCVSETLWRLIDPGDITVDVGANIGYMTSIMALRTGPLGRVIAFEPHPGVYAELKANVNRWTGAIGTGPIVTHCIALSDRSGQGRLAAPDGFDSNRGLAMLISSDDTLNPGQATFTVEIGRLDEIVRSEAIGLLKLDVEGHETNVLMGAEQLMKRRQIRDIVFESHAHYPTPVHRLLEEQGYQVFKLDVSVFGLKVEVAGVGRRQIRRSVDAPSYLATLAPERALSRLSKKGWAALGRALL
jgi:FkbM family methyltransferase